ncbi:ABC transporter permease [Polymorphum gilvum]|uniref:ABC-type dipeptide/oligopeptide/nickel transport systems, permease components n=1 Tax=Polymorphum gilvum (strain LMG 25793 / CGMCC 1.9160 / SL003B-26A1) TaxID=991905 RepID=F2J4I3_POLGS|nr:ABC transporter permease [Polymorphum gilvum]ADZ72236.1 ABC-type dipeptide/oligopeptide/nickel transport systems, permease components [Polymorphum gilvum SL003B-26A1]
MSAVTDDALPAAERNGQDSPFLRNLHNFARNRLAVVAAVLVLVFVVMAVFAPLIAPQDPNETDLFRRLQPPVWMEGGEWAYPLGCDGLGRDILSRIIYGARISIFIGTAVILVATSIGLIAGLAAGYLRGWVDIAISRLVDILLGFPYLIFAIGLMAMMGPGLQNIILALAYKEWVIPCRVVRGETLAAREVEYVEAARALGASRGHIMLREIMPNILSPVIVVSTIRMAHVIILEASLSFLGLGVQPPTASWGSMVSDGRAFILEAWWVSTFPGLAILVLVLAINVASQGLRDAFDPRFHE